MIRAFVAIELTEAVRDAIATWQTKVKDELARELRRTAPDARLQWVKPHAVHLTLKFLGAVHEDQVEPIREALALAATGIPAFTVAVGGMGVFPDLRNPRVLWIGLDPARRGPDSPLATLANAVDLALAALDFPPETKAFTPHLTLARIKERGREVGRALEATGLLRTGGLLGSLPVDSVSLMKSDLKPSGAEYTRLGDVALAQKH